MRYVFNEGGRLILPHDAEHGPPQTLCLQHRPTHPIALKYLTSSLKTTQYKTILKIIF